MMVLKILFYIFTLLLPDAFPIICTHFTFGFRKYLNEDIFKNDMKLGFLWGGVRPKAVLHT